MAWLYANAIRMAYTPATLTITNTGIYYVTKARSAEWLWDQTEDLRFENLGRGFTVTRIQLKGRTKPEDLPGPWAIGNSALYRLLKQARGEAKAQ